VNIAKFPRWLQALRNARRIPEIARVYRSSRTFYPLVQDYLKLRKEQYPWTYVSSFGNKVELKDWWDVTTVWSVFAGREYDVHPTDRTILDFGANIGVFSLYASEIGVQARIDAYEPFPSTYERLVTNIAANGLSGRVKCFNEGVGAVHGVAAMRLDNSVSVCGRVDVLDKKDSNTVEVKISSFEDALERMDVSNIDFVKMDIEGSEEEILLDCSPNSFKKFTRISVEIHKPSVVKDIVARLRSFGFEPRKRHSHGIEQTITLERKRVRSLQSALNV
jgi:FkbM family methyltransferase